MKLWRVIGGAIVLAGLILLMGPGALTAVTQELQRVLVTNLQTPHPIEGQVDVVGPIIHSDMARFEDIVTTPASLRETNLWVDVGTLELDGFTRIVLSVHGTLKGTVQNEGQIGVVLVPDEERILQSLSEGELHLPIQATAEVLRGQETYFSGTEAPQPIAFPRYRVFALNTTDRSASVDVFVYMTN